MKRVTVSELERLAFTHPRSEIERDEDTNVATLRIGPAEFYAQYPAEVQS